MICELTAIPNPRLFVMRVCWLVGILPPSTMTWTTSVSEGKPRPLISLVGTLHNVLSLRDKPETETYLRWDDGPLTRSHTYADILEKQIHQIAFPQMQEENPSKQKLDTQSQDKNLTQDP